MALATGKEPSGEASPDRRLEFEDVLSRNLPRFHRVAMRWLRNPEDAEDAVQDAMLSAFKHMACFEGRAQMSTWLMAIVFNAVRMELRRRARRKLLSLDEPTNDGQYAISDLVADQRPTPEKALEECELRRLVIHLIDSLPPSQKKAMQLRLRDDGLSLKEAAEVLGVPVGTLKAQRARGRVALTRRLRNAVGWSDNSEQDQCLIMDDKPVARMLVTAPSETPYFGRHAMSLSQGKLGEKES